MVVGRQQACIGFGSNQGNRQDLCDRALTLLTLLPHSQVTHISSLYETEPVKDSCNPGTTWFYNGAICLETDLTAQSLLTICQEIERGLGRRDESRDGERPMDLDILWYGSLILQDSQLTLPHPRLHERRFVLTPLCEITPTWKHPILEQTIEVLLRQLDDPSQVRRLDPQPSTRYGSRPTCHSSPAAPE